MPLSPPQTVNESKIDTPVQASEKAHADMTLPTNHGTSLTVSGALSIQDSTDTQINVDAPINDDELTSFIVTPFDGLDNIDIYYQS
ncbi:17171_t:CDS:2, partial [Gigaspora rosea]